LTGREGAQAQALRLPRALPRGRNALPRDVVLVSQRRRLLEAVVESVADKGYTATTVADIVSLAAVSRAAFYRNFADKEHCFLAAYISGSRLLFEQVEGAGRELDDPVEQLRAGTRVYLDVLSRQPSWSRVFLIDVGAVGSGAHEKRREVSGWYVDLLRRWHEGAAAKLGALRPVPAFAFAAAVAAGNDLVATRVRAGRLGDLAGLEDDILYIELSLLGGAGLDGLPQTVDTGTDRLPDDGHGRGRGRLKED
jgi:AcrR family transcriptional regulator